MNCQSHLYTGSPARHHPSLVFPAVRRRPGRDRLGQSVSPSGWASPAALANPLAPKQPHFRAKAKRVIFLFMAGAPSHLELFDYKPELAKCNGKAAAAELLEGLSRGVHQSEFHVARAEIQVCQTRTSRAPSFPNCCRTWPKSSTTLRIVKSMHTDAFNHAPAQIFMNTGSQQFGRPSMGAWVTYGLGSESRDLPAYRRVQFRRKGHQRRRFQLGLAAFCLRFTRACCSAARAIRSYICPIPKASMRRCSATRSTAHQELNQQHLDVVGDPEIATRINSIEMAYRMQTSAPELMDISKEPKHVLEMYGAEPGKSSFANNCLLARRLVERGVRFVQLFHEAWDQHGNLIGDLKKNCKNTDQACAALIKDLKQRGYARRHAGHLGRRVWPHADGAGRQRRPRSSSELLSPCGWRAAA